MLHFGTKTTRKKFGYVADYCLICHCRERFRVFKIAESFHIYKIPLYKKRLLGFERVCDACGQRYPTDVNAYKALSWDTNCDLEVLIQRTNPELTAGLASEIAHQ